MCKKINWVQWLVLPLMMTACMGRESHQPQNHTSDDNHSTHLSSVKKETAKNQSASDKHHTEDKKHSEHSHVDSHSNNESHTDHSHHDSHSNSGSHTDHSHHDNHSGHTHADNHSETEEHAEEETTTVIPKTDITPELEAQVQVAKEIRDNAGLPPGYQATYTIKVGDKTRVETISVPEDNDMENDPFYLNASKIFPQGMSSGTIKGSLLEENEQGELERKPHTEERFMSYQQFYSRVSGTHRDVVYFGDEREENQEGFFFHLPDGLLTTKEQLPTAGKATYNGKAIDGERFGDFRYEVNFAKKEGQGKIAWQETKAGQLGDITLQKGKISEQFLSVYPAAEELPPQYSQEGPGISGVAKIKGSEGKEYQYQAIFFGPKAEELSGLVYEVVSSKHIHVHNHDHDHDHSHDHNHDDGHNHGVEKVNVTAFSGER